MVLPQAFTTTKGRKPKKIIRTRITQVDKLLGRGIPLNSLTLIVGIPSAGKSVLCEHLTYESLHDGRPVAYFTSQHTSGSLIGQMSSIDRDVSKYFREGKLGIYSLKEPARPHNVDGCEDYGRKLAKLASDIERLPNQFRIIIIDDITYTVSHSDETSIIGFFSSCKRLCDNRITIILAARSYVFDEKLRDRLQIV